MRSQILSQNLIILIFSLVFFACKKNGPANPGSPDKRITGFFFSQATNAAFLSEDVTGTIDSSVIKLIVPAETDITNLKPTISFTGSSVSPASGIAQNFTSPVIYTVKAGDGSTRIYTVTVKYTSMVFICTVNGHMYALDGKTGQQFWKVSNGQFHSGTPALYKGIVYISGLDGLYALDAKTGAQRWKLAISGIPHYLNELHSSPVIINNVVYISFWDGYTYALNALDGNLIWKTQSIGGKAFTSNVTVHNNMVYAGCSDSLLYAFNAVTGAITWRHMVDGIVVRNPLIVNNNVYTSGLNGLHCILNAATGAVIWSITPDPGYYSSPTLDNGIIYSGGGSMALGTNAVTGNTMWYINIPSPSGGYYTERSSPIIQDGKFYAGSNSGKFSCQTISTKAVVWSISASVDPIYSSPVIADEIFYIGSRGGRVFAVNAATGSVLWQVSTSGSIIGSPCVSDENGVMHYPGLSGYKN